RRDTFRCHQPEEQRRDSELPVNSRGYAASSRGAGAMSCGWTDKKLYFEWIFSYSLPLEIGVHAYTGDSPKRPITPRTSVTMLKSGSPQAQPALGVAFFILGHSSARSDFYASPP